MLSGIVWVELALAGSSQRDASGSLSVMADHCDANVISEKQNTLTTFARVDGLGRKRDLTEAFGAWETVLNAALDNREPGNGGLENRVVEL